MELLIAFLNDVVGTDIRDNTYLPTEGPGEYREERATNFDLLCTNDRDEFFIVTAKQHGYLAVFVEKHSCPEVLPAGNQG